MALYLGVGTPLGNHRFAHISDGVDVEVGHGSDETVGPVVAGKGHLLARRVLQ